MTTEDQINKLENRIGSIENKLNRIGDSMDAMNGQLERIGRGVYGEGENATEGLIARQRKDENRLQDLEQRVANIEKGVSKEFDELKSQKSVEQVKKSTIREILKHVKEWGIAIAMIYFIFKDIIGVDTLLDLFFKK